MTVIQFVQNRWRLFEGMKLVKLFNREKTTC
jgi:hypothetical protein